MYWLGKEANPERIAWMQRIGVDLSLRALPAREEWPDYAVGYFGEHSLSTRLAILGREDVLSHVPHPALACKALQRPSWAA